MKPQGRLGDMANCPKDSHGCNGCSHNVTGPAVSGSPDVFVNGKPALRVDDAGIHAACCGPNTWTAAAGSATVFINGKPAHRMGDATSHCGGSGNLIQGSSNVFVGDSSSSGSASSSDESTCGICSLKKGAVPTPTEKAPDANEKGMIHLGSNVYVGTGGGAKPDEADKPEPKESPILKEQNRRIEEKKAEMAASANEKGMIHLGNNVFIGSYKGPKPKEEEKEDISFVFIDKENGEPLYQIKSKILYPDNSIVSEIRSSKKGSIEFKNVDKGSYSIETADLDIFHKKEVKMWIGNTYGVTNLEKKDFGFPETIKQSEHLSRHKKYICNIKEYKIQKGDTFSAIAASHDLCFDELGYFNWKTTDKKKILNRILSDIGKAELTDDGQDIQFNEPKKPGILFVPEPWKKEGLESDNSYAVYAKKVTHKNQVLKIGLFFDGTGNSDLDPNAYSNVYNLFDNYNEVEALQQRIYILGVGVENTDKSGDLVDIDFAGMFGNAVGYRAPERLEKAVFEIKRRVERYIEIYNQHPVKIECDIFGFSRGAALARHFVNLIHYKKIDFKDQGANRLLKKDKIKVNFLGIFDTVGSFGMPGDNVDKFEFHVSSGKANYIYHLVSEDERRENFDLQSIIPGRGYAVNIPGEINKFTEYHQISKVKPFSRILYDANNMKEELGTGVHSDLGGGYLKDGFEQGCSNNYLSLVYLRKMYKMALKHNVPFQTLSIAAESEDIELKLEEIDSSYKLYPDLFKEHLKYNKINDFVKYSTEAHKLINQNAFEMGDEVEYVLAHAKSTWEPRIKTATEQLEKQKGKLRKIIPGTDLDIFLKKYSLIEKYKHISHNPFNKKESQDHHKTGTGFNPNVDNEKSELYREFFYNYLHENPDNIDIIDANDHDLGK